MTFLCNLPLSSAARLDDMRRILTLCLGCIEQSDRTARTCHAQRPPSGNFESTVTASFPRWNEIYTVSSAADAFPRDSVERYRRDAPCAMHSPLYQTPHSSDERTPVEGGQEPSVATNRNDSGLYPSPCGSNDASQAVEALQAQHYPLNTTSYPPCMANQLNRPPLLGINPAQPTMPLALHPRGRDRRRHRGTQIDRPRQQCTWEGCGKVMCADSIGRHIREIHKGQKRKPLRRKANAL